MSSIILASQSSARASLLKNAGLRFHAEKAEVDERALAAPLLQADYTPADIAESLAEAKARKISQKYPDALVIGADQTMSYLIEGRLHHGHKVKTKDEARRQLLVLCGREHQLDSAVCCVRNNKVIFSARDKACLIMRNFSPEFLDHYIELAGDALFYSVGCYEIEGPGIQLFSKIEGSYFTILGLPLLPLLDFLREQGMIEQ